MLSLIAALVAPSATFAQCNAGAVGASGSAHDPVTNHCYYGFSTTLSWNAAQSACESIGGHLAVIDSASENTLARSATTASDTAWIGFHDQNVEAGSNAFAFEKVTGGLLTYNGFAPGEPNNLGNAEDCVHFFASSSGWNDEPCAGLKKYLCEVERCGTGTLEIGEQCDDGNTTSGDGCSSSCQIEPCYACGSEPSVCELAVATPSVDTAGDVGHYASIAIGADGLPVISHYDDGNDDLKVTHCNDAQCATRTTTVVADGSGEPAHNAPGSTGGGNAGAHSQIAINGLGNPVIVYQQDGSIVRLARCNDAACTGAPFIYEIDNVGGTNGYETSIAVPADGRPQIAWIRPSTGTPGVWVSRCDNQGCVGSDAARIHTDSGDRSTAMTIGGDGLPLVVFRNSPDDLTIAHCADLDCSSASIQTLDPDTGDGNSIATGTDGFGIISYQDFINNRLRVVHCTNAACSTFDPPVTIVPSNVGRYTSIAIGADGRPLIAYYDSSAGDLKLAQCNNTTCSNGAVIRTIDSTGNVGAWLDLAMGSNGQAYVSYRDATNSDLKLAVCGPVCGDGNKTPDEECDDGDLANGDGCSASCTVETCWDCSGDPSVCAPETAGNSCPSDGIFCNGVESCNGTGTCVGAGDPCIGNGECNVSCNEGADNCFDANGTPCSDEPNPCTVDTCNGAGACSHAAGNAGATCRVDAGACDVAELCDGTNITCPADGFENAGTACGDPANDACTDPDTCNGLGACQVNHAGSGAPCADDGNPCTVDQCDGGGGCVHPAGNAGTECRADAGQCDVAEQCDGSNSTCPNDGFEPSGTACTDGSVCTQTDQCDGSGICVGANPLDCSDGSPCTADACDPGDGCDNPPALASGCKSAAKAILILKQNGGVGDKQLFKWVNGDILTLADLQDPTTSTVYGICMFEGPSNELLESINVPPGAPNWRASGTNGYKYKELNGTNSGITKMLFRGNDTAGRSKALVKGKGDNLPDPILGDMQTPVTVQVINPDTGACVEAVFDTNDVKKNTSTLFKAKAQ